ncbi:MAG: hypothetical protein H0V92_07725 [Pseudonocardiales bacterium]|nr:hypothetical protein [Pseudonocardiales bacterium]
MTFTPVRTPRAVPMLLGEKLDAARALEMGPFTVVVPDADALAAVLAERTAALRDKPREALLAVKSLLRDETATTVPARLDLDQPHPAEPAAQPAPAALSLAGPQ